MFSGGDYDEVARWLENFVRAHAKRENLRVEAVVETEGAREGQSYGVRLRLGEDLRPAPPTPRAGKGTRAGSRPAGQRSWWARRCAGSSRGRPCSRSATAAVASSCATTTGATPTVARSRAPKTRRP